MDAPDLREPGADDGPLVDWRAVFRGALLGLCVLIAASVVEAILDRNLDRFSDSGWIYPLFVAILRLPSVDAGAAPNQSCTNSLPGTIVTAANSRSQSA